MTSSIKKIRKTLDKIWGQKIREKGQCEKCGTTNNLQASHIIPRQVYATRWDLLNGICLCYRCHIHWAHKYPHDFVYWFNRKFPRRYSLLIKRARNKKIDYQKIYQDLTGEKNLLKLN